MCDAVSCCVRRALVIRHLDIAKRTVGIADALDCILGALSPVGRCSALPDPFAPGRLDVTMTDSSGLGTSVHGDTQSVDPMPM
jgi:hypothetical protein